MVGPTCHLSSLLSPFFPALPTTHTHSLSPSLTTASSGRRRSSPAAPYTDLGQRTSSWPLLPTPPHPSSQPLRAASLRPRRRGSPTRPCARGHRRLAALGPPRNARQIPPGAAPSAPRRRGHHHRRLPRAHAVTAGWPPGSSSPQSPPPVAASLSPPSSGADLLCSQPAMAARPSSASADAAHS
jgi:hypothetical protein